MMGLTERELYPKDQTLPVEWYAVSVKPQHEAAVARGLECKGLEPFAPSYRVSRRWSDRTKVLDAPLFAGYVFCHFNPADHRGVVLQTPGVISLVKFGARLAAIPAEEIDRVRIMAASNLPLQPWPCPREGDPIRIETGPLRGLEGVLVQIRNESRIVVSISLLQRAVSAVVDRDTIAPIRARN